MILIFVESGSFRVPEVLILDSCKITSAGLTDDLNRLCSQVTELDLTDNSISSWNEVHSLTLEKYQKIEFSIYLLFAASITYGNAQKVHPHHRR